MTFKNKKAAMEMSVGTIVTIVLLMTVLVLGLFFVQDIFNKGQGALDMTDQELQSQLTKLFGDDTSSRLMTYPSSKELKVKSGEEDAIGIGVRNLATSESDTTFSFEVEPMSISNDCSLTVDDLFDWIYLNGQGTIDVPIGSIKSTKVYFKIPENTPLCTGLFKVRVYDSDENLYDSEEFTVEAKAR
jgi:hypothetical protein